LTFSLFWKIWGGKMYFPKTDIYADSLRRFGKELRRIREAHGLSRLDMAASLEAFAEFPADGKLIARLEMGQRRGITTKLIQAILIALRCNQDERTRLLSCLVPDLEGVRPADGVLQDKDIFNRETPTSSLEGIHQLTDRQYEILQLTCQDKTSKEIAAILFVTKETVDTHWNRIRTKLGTSTRQEVVRLVKQANIF
jgi:DNA-binding CsgD family transcriptional regulator